MEHIEDWERYWQALNARNEFGHRIIEAARDRQSVKLLVMANFRREHRP